VRERCRRERRPHSHSRRDPVRGHRRRLAPHRVADEDDDQLGSQHGFVTGKAAATIDGNGSSAVNSGTLVFGLQLGCQVDLSEGGSIGGDLDAGISPGFNGTGGALSSIGPYADIGGNASINLLPGTITNLGLGKKALKGRTGEIVVHDAHVKVDACGGQVSVRFFASVMIDTDKSDDSVNSYGDILSL
jgi:hypothetical protein